MTEETMPTEASVMDDAQKTEVKQAAQESKFQEMLFKMMTRRWNITAIVLITFMMIVAGITLAVYNQTAIDGESPTSGIIERVRDCIVGRIGIDSTSGDTHHSAVRGVFQCDTSGGD